VLTLTRIYKMRIKKPNKKKYNADYRGIPTEVCPCGSQLWNLKVIFEEKVISMYFLDMECALCGSLATAPTEIDACD